MSPPPILIRYFSWLIAEKWAHRYRHCMQGEPRIIPVLALYYAM